jgi:hypothetical protein
MAKLGSKHARASWWVVTENSSAEPVDVEIAYRRASTLAVAPGAEVEFVTRSTDAPPVLASHDPDGVPWAGAGAAELAALVDWAAAARTDIFISLEHTGGGQCRVDVTVEIPERWETIDDVALSLHGADLDCGQLTAIKRETTDDHSFVELLAIALVELRNLDKTADLRREVANG